jgi:hypothetical protein
MIRPNEADGIEADVRCALEAMYGSDGATDLLGDYRNIVREQVAREVEAYGDRHGTHSNGEPNDDWTRGVYDAADMARGTL